MKKVLFLCTGNYYRSRFAEIVFNWLVTRNGLAWSAFSRALAIEQGIGNIGPISMHTLEALHTRGISSVETERFPQQVTDNDFVIADMVIALKETEHKPYVLERFPMWADKVHYWAVDDLDCAPACEALPRIERNVQELVATLKKQN